MTETENEFEYIDLDLIDQKQEDEDYPVDPINEVKIYRSSDDEVFIVGRKL